MSMRRAASPTGPVHGRTRTAASAARRRALLSPLLLALTAVGLTSCDTPPPLDLCAWTAEPAKSGLGRTVVLVDTSASFHDGAASTSVRDPREAVADYVEKAVAHKESVSVAAFGGGGPTGLRWQKTRSTDWAAEDDNPDSRSQLRTDAVACVQKDVAAAARSTPVTNGTDVLAALRAAGGVLARTSGPRRLVVVSDGLPTTGCADLTRALFRNDAEIDAIAQVCHDRKELTERSLSAVRVVFVGLGQPAADQPVPTAAQQQWLGALWKRLCDGAHPPGDHTAGCDVVDTQLTVQRPARTPSSAQPTNAADPVVTYGDKHRQRYRLPGAALFDKDSAVLRPGAKTVLTRIAVTARSLPGARVSVDGYVDPRGDPADDGPLSQARADAVKDMLQELGVTRITAQGRGQPADCPRGGPAGGSPSGPDRLQCARRVDIEVDA
ncbi:hypothetical protein GCM10010269_53610 [Streptomyces humidus]|uniref:OmpA-like domain-containing protein n=1 Tax=Streptomyces humidus TaxID=52259 RepID=A0A918G035_9ACTN|nr:OmpA family protein [Streptomyces humidus]GGS07843.1 hypothetical protein GCM10010269_53610 [Streptomyces humidus]